MLCERAVPCPGHGCLDRGSLQPTTGVFGNLADVPFSPFFQAAQKRRIATVAFIKGHPVVPQVLAQVAHQFQCQLGLGPENDLRGHTGFGQAMRGIEPFLWQVQAGIQQGVAVLARLGEVDRHLAIGNLAQATQIVPCHADTLVAALGETALSDDENAVVVAQVPIDPGRQFLTQRFVMPRGLTDEDLGHAYLGRIAQDLQGDALCGLVIRGVQQHAAEVASARAGRLSSPSRGANRATNCWKRGNA